ncbi:MAG: NAD(P)/FAD-dependent oxidoreductase [Elusimicrobia bacterium]|nr:NAD(P)/FAD-dependent oxidoreductase [Elusimicrobiota bacterium]
MDEIDAVVVGAGAVGLALAARLARADRNVVVLERHERHGMETSSRNSEVVHSGLYYPAASLKTKLCVEGRRRLYELAPKRGFFVKKTGKLIVACEQGELEKLEALKKNGEANGVEGLELVDGKDLAQFSYGVKAVAALWSPETGIVDSEDLMRAALDEAKDKGAIFLWGCGLSNVGRKDGRYDLWVTGQDEPIPARCVINSAGLNADKIAALAGLDCGAIGYGLHYYKGEYFSLKRPLEVRPLVYPVPSKQGLGIHLTVDRQGRHRLGPNAFPVEKLDYDVDSSHADSFHAAASRYLPDLKREDLMPGTSGIRPKLAADGSFRDFVIAEESARGLPGWVNLLGIESPGLTASLAIADYVANLLSWPR